jgi:hypothetical protein
MAQGVIKSLALELSHAADDLLAAAATLRDKGHAVAANRTKQAEMRVRSKAQEWLG